MERAFGNSDIVAFDYETTGLPHDPNARIFSIAFTWLDGYTEVHYGDFMRRLCQFWQSPCTGIAHNIKFEWYFTNKHRILKNPKKVLHDTMIMSQYVDNLQLSHSLDYTATRYAGYVEGWDKYDNEVAKAAKIYGTYDKIPKYIMLPYQRNDTERTMLLYRLLWEHVEPKSEYFNEIELAKTTAEFEMHGIMVHKENTLKLIDWATKELDKANSEADIIAGKHVNLNSVPQMNDLLFRRLGLPPHDKLEKKDLDELYSATKHPILTCIMKARAYRNGISTMQSYLDLSIDGILYPNILTNRASTGRESSVSPNMQNVRKEMKVGQDYTIPARQCFMPRPGHFLLLADYSGIEMRLGVQGTGSVRLYDLCRKNFDFHSAFATSFYGARYTNEKNPKIKKMLRNTAKNGRFAQFYGAGPETLAETLNIPIETVYKGIEHDKREFPEFYTFMNWCSNHAIRTGYIETFFGRKLLVDKRKPYSATDFRIQGSAAALFKHAQNLVHKAYKILFPVHDELVTEFPDKCKKDIPDILNDMKQRMIAHKQITVPLNVDFSIAKETWNEKEEIESN
jgi:DNA polymerase-1